MSKFIFLGETIYNKNIIKSVQIHSNADCLDKDREYYLKAQIEGMFITVFESANIEDVIKEQGRILEILNS